MDADKYRRSIELLCPTCGGIQFDRDDESVEDDSQLLTCETCKLEITRADLIEANGENINGHVEEIKRQVSKDVEQQLHDTLKRAFRGSKFIKIR